MHATQIESFKNKFKDLPKDQMVELFVHAINAIRFRSQATLSNITVSAVVDRTLYECKEKYPLLATVGSKSGEFNFKDFLGQASKVNNQDLIDSLEYLMIELLDVFGSITAEILTKYLHQELMNISYQNSLNESISSEVKNFRTLKNGEKK